MANKEIATQFTEIKYCSRKEMSQEIGIPSVPEDMWNKVISYRKNFYNALSIKDVDNKNLFICLSPTFSMICKDVNTKLTKFNENLHSVNPTNGDKNALLLKMQIEILKSLVSSLELDIDENRLKRLIVSENPYDDKEEKLLSYLSCLQMLDEGPISIVDEALLTRLYGRFLDVENLTFIYRDSDIADRDSIALVSRLYRSAPHARIPMMMNSLYDFINQSDLSPILKSYIAYYYFSYVKPLKSHNDEMALLFMKAVYNYASHYSISSYMPLETLLMERKDAMRRMFNDVLSSQDVTYFVRPLISSFTKEVDFMNDSLGAFSINVIKNDFYQLDEEKGVEEENKEEILPEPEPVKEEVVEPVIEEVAKEVPIKEVPVENISKKEEINDNIEVVAKVDLAYQPRTQYKIDEKEANRLEKQLLDTDYRLKKSEAHFYARHCVLGVYYSIEQYKKAERCVYETARTAMEHLAALGYYQKFKAGHKFVYTPVKK